MEFITVKCPAKINLSLDVVGKREDGYHLLKMIMQTVSLYDEIELTKIKSGIEIECSNNDIPRDRKNTAYRAAEIIIDKFALKNGVKIKMDKKIPHGAGLGGGSADAAGVIRGMNELFNLKISTKEMMDIGVKIGADVPFCILGGTALAEGIGEILTPISPLPKTNIVIAKPAFSISTLEVYKKLKIDEINRRPNTDRLIAYISAKDVRNLAANMVNALETVVVKEYPQVFEIKRIMESFGAQGSLMTGSGSAVFGIFEDKKDAETCYNRLKDYLKEVFLIETVNE